MELLKFPKDKVILTTPCNPVTDFSAIQSELEEMGKIAFENRLYGMAANQVGINKKMFVYIEKVNEDGKFVYKPFINSKIKPNPKKGSSFDWESCGSIDNMEYLIKRWNEITITYQDASGNTLSETVTGFKARIFQHEQDHLYGQLINSKFREMRMKNERV